MDKLKRLILAGLMCCVVSVGAAAQKQDPTPPPKQPGQDPRVKVEPNKNPPQPERDKGDGKKKP